MIDKVLYVLRNVLDNGEIDAPIVVENISKEDNDGNTTTDRIVITLLSIEEEKTLKNSPRYERVQESNKYIKKSPPAYLNLYVMISANRNLYYESLENISKVIEIIQAKKEELFKGYNFKTQLHSLPFDQLSYAWGLLGGKVLPSVLYKISIIKIQDEDDLQVGLIKNVDLQSAKK
jgi:Pvc16 N-terminal domain